MKAKRRSRPLPQRSKERDPLAGTPDDVIRRSYAIRFTSTPGRAGGKARWQGVSRAERSRLLRAAVQARWAKARPNGAETTPVKSKRSKYIIGLRRATPTTALGRAVGPPAPHETPNEIQVYPRAVTRPVPAEVTEPYASYYRDACVALVDSPKASAMLSHLCLQAILHDKTKGKPEKRRAGINEVVKSSGLPRHIPEVFLDAVRHFRDIAAHPDVGEVNADEAEFCLDVLDALFDFYFVQQPRFVARKAALDAKSRAIAKSPRKGRTPV